MDGRKAKIGITPNPQGARGGGEVIASEYGTGKKKKKKPRHVTVLTTHSKNSAGSRLPICVQMERNKDLQRTKKSDKLKLPHSRVVLCISLFFSFVDLDSTGTVHVAERAHAKAETRANNNYFSARSTCADALRACQGSLRPLVLLVSSWALSDAVFTKRSSIFRKP